MNYIWFFLIAISLIIGAFNGKLDDVVNAAITSTKTTVDISLYLLGIMAFWLGMMKIAENSGLTEAISKLVEPIMIKLFPETKNKQAISAVTMNFSANALGLANAATPFGIKAMQEFQKENKDNETASNSMCMLLAMNTAGFQLIPATVIAILAAFGYKNPTDIIIPTLMVTSIAFVSAILIAKVFERTFPKQKEGSIDER